MKLTQKQEKYAYNIFAGMSQREAYKQAGYSVNYPIAHVDRNASVLANSTKILQRLNELNSQVESSGIMAVQERKERLSEIARGNLTDYQEAGLDGSGYISITKDSPNTAAIAQIESATKFDENGNTGTLFTKIKLHNPVPAIDLLNKMDKIYTEGTTVNIDNRKQEVKFVNFDAKEVARTIIEAERLGISPELLGGISEGEASDILPSHADL